MIAQRQIRIAVMIWPHSLCSSPFFGGWLPIPTSLSNQIPILPASRPNMFSLVTPRKNLKLA